MRRLALLLLTMAGCASIQATHSGRMTLTAPDQSVASIHAAALSAARDAGFAVESSDAAAGMLYATRSANLLTGGRKKISLSVQVQAVERGGGYEVEVLSALPGQLKAWGATEQAVNDFGRALQELLPGVVLAQP